MYTKFGTMIYKQNINKIQLWFVPVVMKVTACKLTPVAFSLAINYVTNVCSSFENHFLEIQIESNYDHYIMSRVFLVFNILGYTLYCSGL